MSRAIARRLGGVSLPPELEAARARLASLPSALQAHLDQALEWIARARPRQAVTTNMHVDLDYATLARELPPGVEPAHDGLALPFSP